jgi:hypothetical protein
MKAADIIKKKGSKSDDKPKKGKGDQLIAWIAKRRGGKKKPAKATEHDEDEE